MAQSEEKLNELIEYLQGSCKTLQEGLNDIFGEDFDEDQLTEEDHQFIDDSIFNCETCGWWYEVADSTEDNNCISCTEEE